MTNDSLMRQIANGDAYAPEFDLPDAARPADVAFADISRRIDMDAKELTRSVEKDPRDRRAGLYAAAAAFAVVVLVIGSVVLLNRSSDPEIPPATTPPTTQTAPPTTEAPTTTAVEAVSAQDLAVIASYEDAVNSGNFDRIAAMLAPGFRSTAQSSAADGYFAEAEAFTYQYLGIILQGATVSYTECVPKEDVVSCVETFTGPFTRIVLGVDFRSQADFRIAGDTVQSIHYRSIVWPDDTAVRNLYDAMKKWAAEEADAETSAALARCMLGDSPNVDVAPLCAEWLQLWTDAGRP